MSLPDNLPPLPPGAPPHPAVFSTASQPAPHIIYSSANPAMFVDQQQMTAAYYQQQQQQYYQQCMYMYAAASAANNLPVQQMQPAYNYNTVSQSVLKNTTESNSNVTINTIQIEASTSQQQQLQKPAIKFNLKFQGSQTKPSPVVSGRKSRFNNNILNGSLPNIEAEQNSFKQKSQENSSNACKSSLVEAAKSVESAVATSASDIASDINKWPANLRTYCTKVYQFYQKQTILSEDQVTKYLQQKITDTFKIKPDLSIDWDNEKIPEVSQIKQIAPFSQHQLDQQRRQQKVHEAAIAAAKARAVEILAEKEKINKQLAEAKKLTPTTPQPSQNKNKRKYSKERSKSPSNPPSSSSSSSSSTSTTTSTSSSSSSSSDSSDDFISLNRKKIAKKNTNSMQRIEKEKLRNIEMNQISNGKKSSRLLQHTLKLSKDYEECSQNERSTNTSDEEEDAENEKDVKQMKLLSTPNKFLSKKQKKLNSSLINRQKRFQVAKGNMKNACHNKKLAGYQNFRTLFSSNSQENSAEEAGMSEICIGLNQDLEKEYLRLTGPPEPIMVRPLEVLKRSLVHVLEKYNKSNEYRYICDQMKAIRQDLTVQMIRNEFTIQVYETHARIALKNKDRDEFNQCQSQLKILYSQLEKNGSNSEDFAKNNAEFIGYRLIYNMLTKSHNDLNQVIKEIKRKYSTNHYLNHLLALRNAWHLNNHVKFFRLYKQCNEMSKCLIDLFIERERKLALKIIIKAYRPSIKLECVKEILAYESMSKCKEDLLAYKLAIISVPLDETSDSSCSNINLPKNTSSSKAACLKNKTGSKQLSFEDFLDCKCSSVQF